MVAEVKMPALSPTMEKGKIVAWNKKEGDVVSVGDVILEVETDKAVMEVEAQDKGILGKILHQVDENVEVNKTIALILEKGETPDVLKDYKIEDISTTDNNTNTDATQHNNDNLAGDANKADASKNIANSNVNCENTIDGKVFASPLAKNIAKINNVNIANISNGSGPNGRIVKADVERFLANNSASSVVSRFIGRNAVEYVDIEPTGMRSAIARRLSESKQQNPHWYLKISADMTNFVNFRNELNKMAKIIDGKPEFKISANDLVVMAIARALRLHPDINASWVNGKIRKYNNVDISVACTIDGGLLTPVVKNADQMGILELSANIKKLVKKAREGKLTPDEYAGGSISVSNLGMYDVEEFISIINPPQSCIVAVGAIKKQVIALEDGNIDIRDFCKLTFSADHRVIDGSVLAPFAKEVKMMLENPAMMLK